MTLCISRQIQVREAGPRQRPAAARALPEDVRRLRQELRPGHGAGEDLDRAFRRLQEHHPGHTGVRLTEALTVRCIYTCTAHHSFVCGLLLISALNQIY